METQPCLGSVILSPCSCPWGIPHTCLPPCGPGLWRAAGSKRRGTFLRRAEDWPGDLDSTPSPHSLLEGGGGWGLDLDIPGPLCTWILPLLVPEATQKGWGEPGKGGGP